MFIDARSVDSGSRLESDVCIVGAGAAGIALGLALAEGGLDVCIVESGGFEPERATQDLYAGAVSGAGYPPLTASRLRYLGGTTNHWGGSCIPLDDFELEAHDWVPHSGWPLRAGDLAPYWGRARQVLDLPSADFGFDPAEAGAAGARPLLGTAPEGFATAVWRRTRNGPLRLREHYAPALRRAPRIRCFHHANVLRLDTNEAGDRVEVARVATLSGRSLDFAAKQYVLCAGAIENARLLLLSDRPDPAGLGNARDLVGRFFADHGGQSLGAIHIVESDARVQEESFLRDHDRIDGDIVGFVATPAFRRRRRTLGFAAMAFGFAHDGARTSDAPGGLRALWERLAGEGGRTPERPAMNFLYVAEKAPSADSRVTLADETDALGMRRVALHLDVGEQDRESIRESSRALGAAVARGGVARLRLEAYDPNVWTGLAGHHSGTTRMADDPARGVTDAHGRIFGVTNLHVAGGSLFPTNGWENPTLTIVALALRLADRLLVGSGAGHRVP